jgi:hypothetical protein
VGFDRNLARVATAEMKIKNTGKKTQARKWSSRPSSIQMISSGLFVSRRYRFEFKREEDWIDHTIVEHEGEFDESDLPALAKASQRITILPVA